jgi:hypothetical protein
MIGGNERVIEVGKCSHGRANGVKMVCILVCNMVCNMMRNMVRNMVCNMVLKWSAHRVKESPLISEIVTHFWVTMR